MPPTHDNNMALPTNEYNENGVHYKVIEFFTEVSQRIARNIPHINEEAMVRRVTSGLGAYDDNVAMRHMRSILTNKEMGIVPQISGQCVDLISRPRKGVPIRECITSSLQEMDRNGNSIRWGMLMSYPANGSSWAVFHAVNYDRKHKVYYETEDRSAYEEFRRGAKAGYFFPFDLTDAFYKEVYTTWRTKGGRTPAVKPYRIDCIVIGDGVDLDTYHIVVERGGTADRSAEGGDPANDGHRLGDLTYYGTIAYDEGDDEHFTWTKVKDAATGEFAVLD